MRFSFYEEKNAQSPQCWGFPARRPSDRDDKIVPPWHDEESIEPSRHRWMDKDG